MKLFKSMNNKETRTGYLFIIPALLVLIVLALYPTLKTIYYSFREYDLIFRINEFTGLRNYSRLINDSDFISSFFNTIIFTITTVFFEGMIGLIIALVINRNFKGRGLVRASILVPWAIPTVITSLMWKWIYNTDYGILNLILMKLSIIGERFNFLGNTDSALACAMSADIWKTVPFIALITLSGLQTIPVALYESAEIDGANKFQQFIKITMPLIKNAFLIALLLRTLDAFRIFDLIFVLTNGGPGGTTEVLSTYAYKTLFSTGQFGYGSTIATSVFISVALLASVYIYFIIKED